MQSVIIKKGRRIAPKSAHYPGKTWPAEQWPPPYGGVVTIQNLNKYSLSYICKERMNSCVCVCVYRMYGVLTGQLSCLVNLYSVNQRRNFCWLHHLDCRSQWPRGLKRRFAAARLLRLCVRIPPRAWMFVCCECCVLSGRGPCDELITRSEESYWLWCVVVCDLETSWMSWPWPTGGCRDKNKQTNITLIEVICQWLTVIEGQ